VYATQRVSKLFLVDFFSLFSPPPAPRRRLLAIAPKILWLPVSGFRAGARMEKFSGYRAF
jgi:hypothetical protein